MHCVRARNDGIDPYGDCLTSRPALRRCLLASLRAATVTVGVVVVVGCW